MEEELSASGSPDIISVLKPPRPRIPLKDIMSAANDDDNTANRKRRVSFANVNKIKEFSAGAESMLVCHTPAYEEPFSMSSDSSYPSGVDGATPAKGNISSTSHATDELDQKEQYPPQLGAVYLRSSMGRPSIGISDYSTVHFPNSRQSLGGMDMTECIDNQLELAGSSTRYSVGMDFTNVVPSERRNSTRYSMAMDLTNAAQSMAGSSTRYSVGMDLTSVVGQDSRMSLSSNAMDFTKAAMSRQLITDQSVNFQPGNMTDPNLDDSSGLDITEAIGNPLQLASLYTVNNTDHTRYSMNGMDFTNCSPARRKSVRYSLVNMDMTDVVSEANNSGLEFTEVINNPIIEATTTRYSLNSMDLTKASGKKNCSRLSLNSNYADTSGFNLEYSASSETSMDFTKPVYNVGQFENRSSVGQNNSSKIGENLEIRKSLGPSLEMEAEYNAGQFENRASVRPSNSSKIGESLEIRKSLGPSLEMEAEYNTGRFEKRVSVGPSNSSKIGENLEIRKSLGPSLEIEAEYNAGQFEKRASVEPSNSSKIRENLEIRKSLCPVDEMNVSKPFVDEDNGSPTPEDLPVTPNKTLVTAKTPIKPVEAQTETIIQQTFKDDKVDSSSFECNLPKLVPTKRTTNTVLNNPANISMNQSVHKSQITESNALYTSEIKTNSIHDQTPAREPKEILQPPNNSLFVDSEKLSNHYQNCLSAENLSQSTSSPAHRDNLNESSQSSQESILSVSKRIETPQQMESSNLSRIKGRKSMAAGNLETLLSEFQDASSIMELSAMSIEEENQPQEENAINEIVNTDRTQTIVISDTESNSEKSTNGKILEDCLMDVSQNDVSVLKDTNDNSETNTQSSSTPSLNNKTLTEINKNESFANDSLNVILVNDNSVDQSFGKKNITITRGAASRFSSVSTLHDSSMDNEKEASLTPQGSELSESSKNSVTATSSGCTTEYSTSRKAKRSFELALEAENDTEESPVKQACLSREDLINNVTAPSFMMQTLEVPNETLSLSNQSSEIIKDKPTSPLTLVTRVSPAKTNISIHEKSSHDSILTETHGVRNITINQTETNEHVNNFSLRIDITTDHNESNMAQDESINIEISRTPRKMDVSKNTLKCDMSKDPVPMCQQSTDDDDSFKFDYNSTTKKKTFANNRCGLSLQPQKSVLSSLNKLKSRPTTIFDEFSELTEEDLLEKLKCYGPPKETSWFSNNRRIRHVTGKNYVCDLVEEWIQLHFTVDSKGHIIESSYKLSCDEDVGEIGELLMQQMMSHLPPQTVPDLLAQMTAPAFTQLAHYGNRLSSICNFHSGKLRGNILTIEVINVRQNFWAFVDINIKNQNLRTSDITISKQKLGELKLSKVREIFKSTTEGPDQLFSFIKELSNLRFG